MCGAAWPAARYSSGRPVRGEVAVIVADLGADGPFEAGLGELPRPHTVGEVLGNLRLDRTQRHEGDGEKSQHHQQDHREGQGHPALVAYPVEDSVHANLPLVDLTHRFLRRTRFDMVT